MYFILFECLIRLFAFHILNSVFIDIQKDIYVQN